MNENERTPAETAADYAVHFADGFFVPCPCCGKEVESPDNGFTSEKEAIACVLLSCASHPVEVTASVDIYPSRIVTSILFSRFL